jgi:hypothetical protein
MNTAPTTKPSVWDKKLRLINEYPNDVSVWSVPLHAHRKPDYRYEQVGFGIAVFKGENLESLLTEWDDTISSFIFHVATGEAKRLSRGEIA